MDQWAKVSLLKGVPESGTGYAGFIQGGNVRMTMNDGPQGYNGYTKDTASKSTQFPALLSIAASFNPETSWKYAQAVAEEFTAKGSNVLLGPDVEIIRSPLSGRSFETLTGEDPYLGSELVRPFVRAVQAKGIIATVKHWLDNNEEIYRQSMNVEVGDREQHEIYMPVFKAAFEAGAGSVMCAYNKVYGEHACENQKLLHDLLREDIGFRGFVVSDWGATHDGVKSAFAGLDVEMPEGDKFSGLSPDEHADRIDKMAGHVLSSWFASGQADGLFASGQAWAGSPASDARTDAHLNVARETIIDSAVLLKNKDGVLPLQGAGKKIVLVGRYCNQVHDSDYLQGSVYSGGGSGYVESFTVVTPYDGIKQKFTDAASVTLAETADDVKSADVAIVCVSAHAEEGWDRTDNQIPDAYALVHGLREKDSGMTIVVLAISPGVVATGWVWDADAALMLFMPGEQVGVAVAQLLNGEASPGGRLPVSLPQDDEQRFTVEQYPGACPPPAPRWCEDMTANFSEGVLIGYRWNDAVGVPSAFPFGYGLTYTEFEFTSQNVLCSKERAVVTMTVKNIGWREDAAVPQLYVSFPSLRPIVRQLRGFQKVDVEKDGEVNIAFFLGPEDWSYYDVAAQEWVSAVSKGENITVSLGSSSTDLPWNRTFSC
jgi:beta-glucosidase